MSKSHEQSVLEQLSNINYQLGMLLDCFRKVSSQLFDTNAELAFISDQLKENDV